ncbi:MAG TPA: ATPase, partial [Actinocrinis sp.]|nr:ATPase [Actinocrinis sp.]
VLIDEVAAGIAARNAAGWDLCLDRLAGHSPAEDAWRGLFARYRTAFEPELGPQEGPPAGFEDRA